MSAVSEAALKLLHSADWVMAVSDSSDPAVVREVLAACAEVMLPYWDARFEKDDAMSSLVAAMRDVLSNPTEAALASLDSLIPRRRVVRYRDLSPAPGFDFDRIGSDCPADFAGDAITDAATAIANLDEEGRKSDSGSALDASIEAIARLLAERDLADESNCDYRIAATDYIRAMLIRRLLHHVAEK